MGESDSETADLFCQETGAHFRGKLKTPMLVVSSDRKSISSIGDAKLLGGISENTEFMELKANTAFELFTKVIDQVSDWLKERL